MNSVVLMGRLVRDPELRYVANGKPVTRFTLAVDRQLSKEKRQEFEQKGTPTADFIPVTVWGRMAELCAQNLAKGGRVAVEGRITTSSSTGPDGQRRYYTDVTANTIDFIDWSDSKNSGGYQQAPGYGNSYQQGGYGSKQYGGGFQGSQSSDMGFEPDYGSDFGYPDGDDMKEADGVNVPF